MVDIRRKRRPFPGLTHVVLLAGLSLFVSAFFRSKADFQRVFFEDIRASAGVDFQLRAYRTEQKYLIETMGGGVAVFDFDGDAWLDIFFVNGFPLEGASSIGEIGGPKTGVDANRLYRNKGDATFEDVTEKAGLEGRGYGMGVATGDYNNDGWMDLYVTAVGQNYLYRNNGDGTFTDLSEVAGVKGASGR